jgi:hypothetical protein
VSFIGMVTTRLDSAVRRIVRATPALIAAAMLASCGGGGEVDADLVLAGGLIWYGPGAPVAAGETPTAVAIANGKVLAVGIRRRARGVRGTGDPANRPADVA